METRLNTACHCKKALVFSFTQLAKASLGHGAEGSWQYFVKQPRVSSEDAGSPLKPGHWHFGYAPSFLHMFSQSGPPTLFCNRARIPKSSFIQDIAASLPRMPPRA